MAGGDRSAEFVGPDDIHVGSAVAATQVAGDVQAQGPWPKRPVIGWDGDVGFVRHHGIHELSHLG